MKASLLVSRILALGAVIGILSSCQPLMQEIDYRQAQAAHNRGDYERAITYYKKVLAMDPDNSFARYDLTVAYLDSKRFRSARKQIRALRRRGEGTLADRLDRLMEAALALAE